MVLNCSTTSGFPEIRRVIFRSLAIESAQGGVDVFGLQTLDHLIHAHAQRLQADRIDIDVAPPAWMARPGPPCPLRGRFSIRRLTFFSTRVVRSRGDMALRADGQRYGGDGRNVQLLDDGFLNGLGQVAADRVDLGPGLLGGLVDPDLQVEFHDHLGDAFPGDGNDVLDPGDGVDRLFDPFGHLPLHGFRRGPGDTW